jgi:hypothetical protein
MDLLKKSVKNNLFWIVLIVIFTIPSFWNLLRQGYFPMQDDLQAFRVQQMDKCLSDLQIPCRWVPDAGYGYGYPQFNYYPPSVYYAGAILHRFGIQYIDTVKILFVLGYIGSALAMFIFVNALLGQWPAFVASVLYTYVPYKAVEVYVRGAMSEFWSLTFFPLILWSIYMLVNKKKKKYFAWFALFLGLLLTTHNLMSLIFAPVAIVWSIYWIIAKNKSEYLNYKKWKPVVLSGLLGVGLAAFFTLPVIIEKKFAHVDSVLSGYFDYRQHFVSLYKLFLSREWGYGSSGFPNEKLNLSLGIVQWISGIGAGILALLNFKKDKQRSILVIGIILLTVFSIFMIHMKSSFIWAQLPFLWYLQFPWRFLAVSIFLLSLLVGYFVFLSGKFKYLVGVVLIAAAFILNVGYFVPKDWFYITDKDKFSGINWQKQMTISIFDYLPIYAELPPINEAPKTPEVLDGNALFINYEKGSDFQIGEVKVIDESIIRLPLFDFPGMEVRVDGQKIDYVNNDCRGEEFCYGLITFKIQSGQHKIEARLKDTPIRMVGNIVSLSSLVILLILAFKRKDE